MNNTCIVVADNARARVFTVVAGDRPRCKLQLLERLALVNPEARVRSGDNFAEVTSERDASQQAGPGHPIGAQRDRHRLEQAGRFGSEIVGRVAELVADWHEGRILLIADPQLLGLMRARLRGALKDTIKLEELARDYSALSTTQLEGLFSSERLFQ